MAPNMSNEQMKERLSRHGGRYEDHNALSWDTKNVRLVNDTLEDEINNERIQQLNITSEQYGSLFMPIIMSKLPYEIRLEIARKSTTEVSKFEELLETTKSEMRQDKRVKYSRHKNFINESKTMSQIIQYRF